MLVRRYSSKGLLTSSTIAAACAAPLPAVAQTALPPVVVESTSRAVEPARQKPSPTPAAATVPDSAAATSGQDASSAGNAGGYEAVAPATGGLAGAEIDPGRLLANQGSSVSVVTGEDLREQQVRTPVDALRGLPGVDVNRTGSTGGLAQVRIRGQDARHTTVLIDGVEVNNPGDGEFDFSNLVAGEEIDRIEVLRGPQSGLYGSGAIGGVVNIVTKSGKGPATVVVRGETGSFGTQDAAAQISGGNDRIWGLYGITTHRTDGFVPAPGGQQPMGSNTTSLVAKGGVSPFDGFTIEGALRQSYKSGGRTSEDYSVPADTLIPQTDSMSSYSSRFRMGHVEAKLVSFGGVLTQAWRVEHTKITNDDLDATPAFLPFTSYDTYTATLLQYRYTGTVRLDTPGLPDVRHFVTGMAEHKSDSFTEYASFADQLPHDRYVRSFVGEVRGEYFNSLFLSASARSDDSDRYGEFETWRTTASWKVPSTPVRLHASAGTGLKLPSLFEQFGKVPNFFSPNPSLQPETSQGWDTGAELTLLHGAAILDATWFQSDLHNQIASANAATTVVNLPGISTRSGLELSARLKPTEAITLGASYTLLDAKTPAGIADIRRPHDSARIDGSYTFDHGRARVGVAAIYNGTMIDEAFRTANTGFVFPLSVARVQLRDNWVLNATASYQLTPQFEVYGRIENAADARYQEVYGFEAPGTAVYIGGRLKLEDKTGILAAR